ncbi:MAG: hypothetical protein ACOY0R_09615 [Chloroflexota bacterium]
MKLYLKIQFFTVALLGWLSGIWIVFPYTKDFLMAYNVTLVFLNKNFIPNYAIVASILGGVGVLLFTIAATIILTPIILVRNRKNKLTSILARAVGIYVTSFVGSMLGFYGFSLMYQSLGIVFFSILEVLLN